MRADCASHSHEGELAVIVSALTSIDAIFSEQSEITHQADLNIDHF
jgi:hypothetical protein